MKKSTIFQSASFFAFGLFFLFSCSEQEDLLEPSLETTSKAKTEKSMKGANKADMGSPVERTYMVDLEALNNSGVTGTATVTVEGNQLTVTVQAEGLEPLMPHPQHIHGFVDMNKNSTCPTMAADTNGDGLVGLVEGLPSYGPVLLELYEPIDVFPVASADGTLTFERTFTLGEQEFEEEGQLISYKDLKPLQNRAIVLHGMTVNGEYNPVLPVACGQLKVQPKGKKHNM